MTIRYILQNKKKLVCFTDKPENPGGILIQSGYLHYAFAKAPAFTEKIVAHFNQPGEYGFAGIPRAITQALCAAYQVDWSNHCSAYALDKDAYHPKRQVHPTRPLDLEDAEMVDHYYPYSGDRTIRMIQDDLENRPSAAVFIDDKPAAWVLQHPDGTMGMMHTLEEYRHMGLARDSSLGLIKELLKRGEIPMVQIAEDNTASQTLAKSCGFLPFGTADWFGIVVK